MLIYAYVKLKHLFQNLSYKLKYRLSVRKDGAIFIICSKGPVERAMSQINTALNSIHCLKDLRRNETL